MGFDETDVSTIWRSGEYKDWEDATVHALIHGLYYGTGAFEGTRAYGTDRGPAIFRQEEHLERLYQPARPYDMEIPYTHEKLTEAMLEVIHRNDLDSGHIHPIASYGYDSLGVSPKDDPTKVVIAAWSQGTYLGKGTLENGVDMMVSSRYKHTSSQILANAKTIGPYVNSMLVGEEAHRNGYIKAIVLDEEGNVAEGPGENIFMVRDGKIYTPDFPQGILNGITHDAVIILARERGYEVDDSATISRGGLSTANGLFFTDSAAKMTPIRKADNVVIGEGARGPTMKELQSVFFDFVEHRTDDHEEWFACIDEQ